MACPRAQREDRRRLLRVTDDCRRRMDCEGLAESQPSERRRCSACRVVSSPVGVRERRAVVAGNTVGRPVERAKWEAIPDLRYRHGARGGAHGTSVCRRVGGVAAGQAARAGDFSTRKRLQWAATRVDTSAPLTDGKGGVFCAE